MAKGEIFKGLPKWSQGILVVAITGVAIYGGIKLAKYLKGRAQDKDTRKVGEDSGTEAEKLVKSGMKLTGTKPDYEATANSIALLLDGCETFSSEYDVITKIKKIVKNKADWYYLVSVFGTRKIKDCGTFGWGEGTSYDLVSLLTDQLDTSAGKLYNGKTSLELLRNYLTTIGVTI